MVRIASGIRPVHTAISGRARLCVPSLRNSVTLKRYLETMLATRRGVVSVTASIWTGNILVRYDRSLSLGLLIETIEEVLARKAALQKDQKDMRASRTSPGSWHLMQAAQVLRHFDGSLHGLAREVVQERLKHYGPNALARIESRSRLEILRDQFGSLPVVLLIGAAALSALTGGLADTIAIMSVVVLNAAIGYATESHAERTIGALSAPMNHRVPVIRNGEHALVFIEDVVPGDLLELRAGVAIAADARIIEAQGLSVNESTLTGESVPVPKMAEALATEVSIADRSNMVYRGTVITGGSGLAVAVATGSSTEIGQVQALVDTASAPQTPLQRQLSVLGRQLTLVTAGACGLVFVIGSLRGYGLAQTLRNSVALGIAAVPEGLPALATTTLALGIERMRRRKILVRRLEAVETLASVRVVCLDKTGTITFNRMTVDEICCRANSYHSAGDRVLGRDDQPVRFGEAPDLDKVAEIVALCSEATVTQNGHQPELNGSPTENALIELALTLGIDVASLRQRHPLIGATYRSERQLFMATLHEAGEGNNLLTVKGSPEEVLNLCDRTLNGAEEVPITEELRRLILQDNGRLAGEGQRVLGAAYAPYHSRIMPRSLPSLIWAGLVGMADPLRPGIAELLGVFRRAGISPVILTGDQKGTAEAIARKLDLGNGQLRIADSSEIGRVAALRESSQIPHLFARITPAQKLQIVKALQGVGLVVAMTGDGVNDSPALKAADIGIAMGRSGSEVARDVAHIVFQDDNLVSLVPAIIEGRTTYKNIRKAIRYLLATNLSEIITVAGATASGLGQPLAPAQLLWINLISDVFPALALGLDPPEPNIMRSPPRDPHEEIVGWQDFETLGREAAVISAGALGAYAYGVSRYGATSRARTMCFASLIIAQLLHALSSRSPRHGAFSPALPSNRILSAVLAGSFVLQSVAVLFAPLRGLLGITPIGLADALVALSAGVLPFAANEALKKAKATPLSEPAFL